MIRDILDSFQLYGNAKGGPLRNLHEFADVTDPNFHHERQYEIHRYLFSKGDDDDDDDDYNTRLPGKRINCAPLHGLAPRASVLPADFG